MTSVQYSGAAVPLGGIGQFAGTWPGQPTVASPLNAIRNGTGKYWTSVDYQAGQNSPGQARPMSSFRRNMWTLQSPYISPGPILQNPTPTIQADEINLQGPAYYSVNIQTAKNFNLYVAPGGGIYGASACGGNGGGGGAGTPYAQPTVTYPAVMYSGYPGGAGVSSSQYALTVQGGGVVVYNYGTIYGSGGGGGGGGGSASVGGGGGGGQTGGTAGASPNQFPGPLYPAAGTGMIPTAQAGQGSGGAGGQGAYIVRFPVPGQPGPAPGPYFVTLTGGGGGPAGGYGQAGGSGSGGTVQWVFNTTQLQNRGTSGGGGAAAAAVSSSGGVQYVVAGTHN